MSIDKITMEFAPTIPARPGVVLRREPVSATDPQPEPVGLEIEDDAGGDPYNRTGQHCLAELKQRHR